MINVQVIYVYIHIKKYRMYHLHVLKPAACNYMQSLAFVPASPLNNRNEVPIKLEAL